MSSAPAAFAEVSLEDFEGVVDVGIRELDLFGLGIRELDLFGLGVRELDFLGLRVPRKGLLSVHRILHPTL